MLWKKRHELRRINLRLLSRRFVFAQDVFWFPRSSVGSRLDRSSGQLLSARAPGQAFPHACPERSRRAGQLAWAAVLPRASRVMVRAGVPPRVAERAVLTVLLRALWAALLRALQATVQTAAL